jgi:hypothetical protein
VDFFLDWYPPNVGELHRTGLTNTLSRLFVLLFIVFIVLLVKSVKAYHTSYTACEDFHLLLKKISSMLHSANWTTSICFSPRETNKCAHMLAQCGFTASFSISIVEHACCSYFKFSLDVWCWSFYLPPFFLVNAKPPLYKKIIIKNDIF